MKNPITPAVFGNLFALMILTAVHQANAGDIISIDFDSLGYRNG